MPQHERGVDTESENEIPEIMKRPVKYMRGKIASYSVKDLGGNVVVTLVTVLNMYSFWVASLVFTTTGANQLQRWWIRFYISNLNHRNKAQRMVSFFITLGKSWIWICICSELVQFCILLALDALREDAFEAYRRAVLGEAKREVEQGRLWVSHWGPESLVQWRKVLNWLMQVTLHLTLVIVPLALCSSALASGEDDFVRQNLKWSFAEVPAACLHVLAFYLAMAATDIAVKVSAFRHAWETSERQETGSECSDDSDMEGSDIETVSREGLAARVLSGIVSEMSDQEDAGHIAAESDQEDAGHSAADQLNICVALCRCFTVVKFFVPHLLWIGAVLVGLLSGGNLLVSAGLFLGLLVCCYRGGVLSQAAVRSRQPQNDEDAARNEALTRWGIRYCGLDFYSQMRSRLAPGIVLLSFGYTFALGGLWLLTAACMFLLLLLVIKQAIIYVERPYGWLIGLAEGSLFHLLIAILVLVVDTDRNVGDFFSVLALSVVRSLGLKRDISDCRFVKQLSKFWFALVQFVVVTIVIANFGDAGKEQDWTQFCDESLPNCTFSHFGYLDPQETAWPQCSMRFSRQGGLKPLTLTDFGLFSSLAYESQETVEVGLKMYFPDWHIDDRHFTTSPIFEDAGGVEQGVDWTTFYQFTDSTNRTSVFAVRGTQYLIDVLQDVDLWLPAVMIYIFEMIGPNLNEWYVDAVVAVTNSGRREYEKKAFEALLQRIQKQMRAYPDRQFFITGHSLGGGVAKLAAAQMPYLESGRALPAIVFAAPGLSATGYLVYGARRSPDLARVAVTVLPENDIVSRVDKQEGSIVRVACGGSVLQCHSILNTLCRLYETCGSMRPGENFTLAAPCPLLKNAG